MSENKIDPARIRKLLSHAFAQNPTAHELVLYRFGLENSSEPCKLKCERPMDDLAMLLGIDSSENVEELLNNALRDLRGH